MVGLCGSALEVALQLKRSWITEGRSRSGKSSLHTQPTYHNRNEMFRCDAFCSFLATLLRQFLVPR
jgi:hypothetical protein